MNKPTKPQTKAEKIGFTILFGIAATATAVISIPITILHPAFLVLRQAREHYIDAMTPDEPIEAEQELAMNAWPNHQNVSTLVPRSAPIDPQQWKPCGFAGHGPKAEGLIIHTPSGEHHAKP